MTDPVKSIALRIKQRCGPGVSARIIDQRSVAWHSLLFNGARHRIGMSLRGDGVKEALKSVSELIEESDIAISGHLLAELRVAELSWECDAALITLDALTVEAS